MRPRFPRRRRHRAALAVALAALAVPAWLALGHAGALSAPLARAGPGDVVAFHVTATDAAGLVRFTTDADVAARELARGNPHLATDLARYPYLERRARLTPSTGEPLEVATWLLGARAGDVVATPPLDDPFGPRPLVVVARAHGPFPAAEAREALALAPGARAYAAALDANVTLAPAGSQGVALVLDVAPGDRLHPRACRLPIGLPSRPLVVASVNATHVALHARDDPRAAAYGETLTLTFRVTGVVQAHDPRAAFASPWTR